MKIDFTILWIDDQPGHIRTLQRGIRLFLTEKGFNLVVIEKSSVSEVDEYIGQHIQTDGVDLVLVDLNIGANGEEGGTQVLSKMRIKFPYKDIVFYTSINPEVLRQIAFDANIDSVYFFSRPNLVQDTCELIESTLSRVLDLAHMRGIVMSATSDIDFMVNGIIKAHYEELEDEVQSKCLEKIFAQLNKKLIKFSKDIERVKEENTIDALLNLRHSFTANDRLRLLTHIDNIKANTEQNKKVKLYIRNIVKRRNELAHVMLRIENGRQIVDGFSIEDMTKLRCDLVEHFENFKDIAVIFDVDFN